MSVEPPFRYDWEKLPFKKIREFARALVRHLSRLRPIPGNGLEVTPNGFRIASSSEDSTPYKPPFHPTLGAPETGGNRELTVAPGYIHTQAKATGSTPLPIEPIMPEILSVALDYETPNTLPLPGGEDNVIMFEFTLDSFLETFGTHTENGGTNVGLELVIQPSGAIITIDDTSGIGLPGHVHGVTQLPHNHVGIVPMDWEYFYHNTISGTPPQIVTHPSDNLPTSGIFVKLGRYKLDTDGEIEESEWYWHSDFPFPIPAVLREVDPDP